MRVSGTLKSRIQGLKRLSRVLYLYPAWQIVRFLFSRWQDVDFVTSKRGFFADAWNTFNSPRFALIGSIAAVLIGIFLYLLDRGLRVDSALNQDQWHETPEYDLTSDYELKARPLAPGITEYTSVPKSRTTDAGLTIAYNGGKYDHKEMDGKKMLFRTIRLQLENMSNRDIDGIKVKAERFISLGAVVQQVPLRIQHDEYRNKQGGFSLSPGEKEMVDVVERQVGSDFISLCHSLSNPFVTREKNFKLNVVVTAKGQPKQQKRLRIAVDHVELLRCEPLKE